MSLYLVTGGAGFIGSHLCEALLARGDRVRVLDDLSTGRRTNLPDEVELVVGDVVDPEAVRRALAGAAGCFHLAAIASVQRGNAEWLRTHQVNLTGAVALFDAVRRSATIPVVYASSAAVYGDAAELPINEQAAPQPLSAYGADKYGCELHARVAQHVHGVPTVGLRLFNVYGPRQDPTSPYSGVISIFCERLRSGEPIEIFGDGEQTRDFVYVADVVAAMLAVMRDPPSQAEVFNVCTGARTSVRSLALTLAELASRRPDLRHHPERPGDIRHSVGAPDRLRRRFTLPPATELRTGLTATMEWLSRAPA